MLWDKEEKVKAVTGIYDYLNISKLTENEIKKYANKLKWDISNYKIINEKNEEYLFS